ncbi:MAG: excinuclease ABC subunit UvrC [Saprospiraceae bacterium]
MTDKEYRDFSPSIPTDPGVYTFMDANGGILYVGKAKNLRNRLNSYFNNKNNQTVKTRTLVRNAHHIEFTMVETEQDALLLENTLIKKHQPRYNVMLKDEKSPLVYICVKKERFPRVFITRKTIKDGSAYFGPYLNKKKVDEIAELIRKLFQLRTCALNLSAHNIKRGAFKPCLEYHIKNCAAPCVGLETEEAYEQKIAQIKNMLRGSFAPVKNHLREQMQAHAERMEFEQAQALKEKLSLFEDYQSKSTVVNPSIADVDVFSIASDEQEAYVNYLKVVNGAVINTYLLTLTKNLNEEEDTLLAYAIPYLRDKFNSIAPEIIAPMPIALPPEIDCMVTVPKIGDKKKLLELSQKNVEYHLLRKKRERMNQTGRQSAAERILRTLQKDLNMAAVPVHIECFDNSNLQGANPVSSCVVFVNAKPAKREYRHYNVKTVEGPNDFASMEEVVYRRYKRLLAEGKSLPQLIVIDGGKGQLSAAMKSLNALGIADRIVTIGIAKKLEEVFFPDDPTPLHINKKSESLKLIQQARNEAHRFAISFHRKQRSRHFIQTELSEIQGIGPKSIEKLLSAFGSVKGVREASPETLAGLIGKAAADRIRRYFESGGVGGDSAA